MSERLNDEQARAVGWRASGVALSSGAGCGKTTVLTRRFLEEMTGTGRPDRPRPRPLGSVVALTFTEKAARQLRGRVRKACREQFDSGGEDAARWRAVLRTLEAAPIGTFHNFCGRLLRRFPLEANVEPGFAVLEESVAPALRDRAVARRLRAWLADGNDDLIDLATDLGIGGLRGTITSLIEGHGRGSLKAWSEREAEDVVAEWLRVFEEEVRPAVDEDIRRAALACHQFLLENPCSEKAKVMTEYRLRLLDVLPAVSSAGGVAWLAEVREWAKVHGSREPHWPSPYAFEEVKARFEAFRDVIKKSILVLDWDEADTFEAASRGVRLARLAAGALEEYDEAKWREGLLDFDDMIFKTLDLLRDSPEGLPELLAEEVDRLLVDEFQDTDAAQGEILRLLTGQRHGDEGEAGGRLFFVGDPKQSIYRFRGAQPGIFHDFRERLPEEGRHALTVNFRSVPGVIHFVNALFAETFPGPDVALRPHRPPVGERERPAVEFLWAAVPPGLGPDPKPTAFQRRQIEARWVARRIAQIAEGTEGIAIRDDKGEVRPATPGDVVLLFRSLGDAMPYEKALEDEGLDYQVVGGKAYFAQQEVTDLINLLTTVEDPLDPLALAGTLRSPFFCVSDEGLFWLAAGDGGRGDLPENFERGRGAEGLSAEDRRLLGRAHDLLSSWRAAKDRVSMADLLARALDESGYELALLAERNGPRRRANVRKLVDIARRFDRQGGLTLADFVAKLRHDLHEVPREDEAATSEEDGQSVRLMTVHQAKGLEFPIVILPDLDRRPPNERTSVVFSPELGPLVRPSSEPADDESPDDEPAPSLGRLVHRFINSREEAEEALRLFYVATTRAQDYLILSSAGDPDATPSSHAMKLLAARFDRRTGECLGPLPGGLETPRVRVVRDEPKPEGRLRSKTGSSRSLLAVAEAVERSASPTSSLDGILPSPLSEGGSRGVLTPSGRPPHETDPPVPPLHKGGRVTTSAGAMTSGQRSWSSHGRIELDPVRGLSPGAAREESLIRMVLADPAALDLDAIDGLIDRAARRVVPTVPTRARQTVRGWLSPWLGGALARRLARAARVRRAVDWTLTWPPSSDRPGVIRGHLDFAVPDGDGGCELIVVSHPAADESRERLRLLFSARAAAGLGLGPVVRGWRVRLGPGGGLHGEEEFGDDAIEAALKAIR